jgi:predicted anti-sigma-YlaC factor YlaD
MKHPSESLLNEYLDGALPLVERHRVETHLAGCQRCRVELESLQNVFQSLANLPDRPLQRDLRKPVLERIKRVPLIRTWNLVVAVQAGFVLGCVILLVQSLITKWDRWTSQLFGSLGELGTGFNRLLDSAQAVSIPELLNRFTVHMQSPVFKIDGRLCLILGVAVALLFLVGNISLLHRSEK